jgi:hypothetical protein
MATTVKHMANLGDVIASLAGLKKYYEITGKKIIFCQQLNVEANYYAGAVHPTTSNEGVQVMMNERMFEMMKPLLLSQEYIEDVVIFNGQKIDIDLDVIRSKVFVNMPQQAIQQWIMLAYPDLAADLSKAWISVDGVIDISNCNFKYDSLPTTEMTVNNLSDKIILNFTERYRNHIINYYFLKQYQTQLVFAGTENEKNIFCDKWGLDIPYLKINNFLQLAAIVKKSKFLLSNQSFLWNICEAMKTPRILELCQYAANCQPFIGEDSYGFYHQVGVEYYFEKLMNK